MVMISYDFEPTNYSFGHLRKFIEASGIVESKTQTAGRDKITGCRVARGAAQANGNHSQPTLANLKTPGELQSYAERFRRATHRLVQEKGRAGRVF